VLCLIVSLTPFRRALSGEYPCMARTIPTGLRHRPGSLFAPHTNLWYAPGGHQEVARLDTKGRHRARATSGTYPILYRTRMSGSGLPGQQIGDTAWSGHTDHRATDELADDAVHPDAGTNGPTQPDSHHAKRHGNTCPIRRGLYSDHPAHRPGLRRAQPLRLNAPQRRSGPAGHRNPPGAGIKS
jgi:hypothetical protein